MKENLLTDTKIKGFRPREKNYLVPDGNGLYLRVNPKGSKVWVVRAHENGKPVDRRIGEYPTVSLKDARRQRNEMKERIKSGLSAIERRPTFFDVGTEWYEVKTGAKQYAEGYLATIVYRLDHYIYPHIGMKYMDELDRDDVMKFLDRLAKAGRADTAKRCAEIVQQVFVFALNRRIIEHNPATDITAALPRPQVRHFQSIKDPDGLGRMIGRIRELDSPVVRAALLVTAYCFPRCGELLASTWAEIDFDKALWTIPAGHTKLRREHLIPFPTQIADVLQQLYRFEKNSIHRGRVIGNCLVFPTFQPRKEKYAAITEAALLKTLRTIVNNAAGDGVLIPPTTVHGFRHTASTFLHRLGFNSLVVEMQMAHKDPNAVRAIYNSYEFLLERRDMLQKYADYLDSLCP